MTVEKNPFHNGGPRAGNPHFRAMQTAAIAYPLDKAPEWVAVQAAFANAVLGEIDSAPSSYDVCCAGHFTGQAGVMVHTPHALEDGSRTAVLAARVFGHISPVDGNATVSRFELTLDRDAQVAKATEWARTRSKPAFGG